MCKDVQSKSLRSWLGLAKPWLAFIRFIYQGATFYSSQCQQRCNVATNQLIQATSRQDLLVLNNSDLHQKRPSQSTRTTDLCPTPLPDRLIMCLAFTTSARSVKYSTTGLLFLSQLRTWFFRIWVVVPQELHEKSSMRFTCGETWLWK